MGNRCSKCVNSTQSKIITLVDESDAAKALPQLEKRVKFDNEITDDVDPYLKVQLHTAIKKNDPRLVTQILEKREIGLTESIGMIGYDQTALHIAAKYNGDNSMRAILEFIKANQPDKLTFYLRLADSDGNSPPMVCMYHDSPDAFTVFLEYKEHFEFNQRNKKNMTIQEVGKKYSLACLNLLNGIANKNMDIDVQMIQDQKAKEAEMLRQQEEMRRQQEEMFRQQEEAHRLEAERAQKEKERLEQELQAQQAAELERARLEALRQQEIEAQKAAELERLRIEQEKEAKRQADLESARLEALEILGQNQNQPEMTQKPSKDIVKTPRALQKEPSGALQFRYPEILARYHGRNPFQVYFQDPDFPPIIKSLCNDTSHKYYEKYFKTAVWMRPHELLKKDDYSQIKLFDNINPNDVSQGLLGVCYLLSSMSSIAENPPRLQKIFNTKESNPYGVYSVTFYSTGIPTEIIVDDRFPCYENGGGPLFSKPKGDELWVLVLEKAWAKLFGNYCVTEAGLMSDALDALLGAPTELVHIDKDTTTDKVWADFISWEKEEYVLCCATKGDIDQEKTGLVGGHAYTVLGVYELGSHRLLKLRNPWGKFEWKGDFSDNSPLWTVEYKMAVAYTNADDGVFCMTVEDFVKHMDYYTVCYYKDDYHRCHMEIESQARHPEYFEFELEEASLLNIEVLQKDKRHFPESAGYDYSPVEIMLVKKEGNEFNLISENQGYWGKRNYCLREKTSNYLPLEAGSYLLRVKVFWRKDGAGKFTLACNSQKKVKIQRVDRETCKQFLRTYMLPAAREDKEKNDIGNECIFSSGWISPYMYCYVKNNGSGNLNLNVEITKSENIRISKRFSQDGKSFVLKVPKGGEELVFLKKIERTGGGSIGWSFSSEYEVMNESGEGGRKD